MKFALHVMTKYKQQLGKLLFVFAACRPYNYHAALRNWRHTSSHATSKMPPICKLDVLLSPFHNALMLQHLLHWHWHILTEHKAVAERGAPGSWWGPHVTGRWGLGAISCGPQNFMFRSVPERSGFSSMPKWINVKWKCHYFSQNLQMTLCCVKQLYTKRSQPHVESEGRGKNAIPVSTNSIRE